MREQSSLFSKLEHVRGVLDHLIVLSLLGLGSILATNMAPEESALQYTLRIYHVRDLSVAQIHLINRTKRALSVEAYLPTLKIIRYASSAFSDNSQAQSIAGWSGKLKPRQGVEILFVIEGDLPDGLAPKLIRAKYNSIDESTGAVIEKRAELREESTSLVSHSVRYAAWFMAPLLTAGGLFVLVVWYRGRRSSGAGPSHPPREEPEKEGREPGVK